MISPKLQKLTLELALFKALSADIYMYFFVAHSLNNLKNVLQKNLKI